MGERRALIFGACGQDGPYLASYLHSLGYKVYGTAHPLEDSHLAAIRAPEMLIAPCDVSDPLSVIAALDGCGPTEIYMLAAISATASASAAPTLAMKTVTHGLIAALEWVKTSDARLFHASSAAIFGFSAPPQDEDTRRAPGSFYGVTKLCAHELVRIYREHSDAYAVNGILFNHESIWRPDTFVTRKITVAAAAMKPLRLGNLKAVRDWGYAGDHVRAMHLMLQQNELQDLVISTGEGHTVEEFANYALEASGGPDAIGHDPRYDRPTDTLVGDNRKLQQLGWMSTCSLKDLVEAMVDADIKRLGGMTEQQLVDMERAGKFLLVP